MSTKADDGLEEQLEALYTEHVDMVYRIAMLYLKNPASAEDAVQDVFVKLMGWLARGHFQGAEHTKHWLIVTAKNTCLDELRRRRRKLICMVEEPFDLENADAGHVWQYGQGPEGERLGEVHEALMKLPEAYRLLVYLFYFEGYSSAEIAGMLHINHGTVRTRLRTARRRMRILLEEEENET